jgi:hypothetical protein
VTQHGKHAQRQTEFTNNKPRPKKKEREVKRCVVEREYAGNQGGLVPEVAGSIPAAALFFIFCFLLPLSSSLEMFFSFLPAPQNDFLLLAGEP